MNANLLILYKGIKLTTGKVDLHTHPFWQLEIATRHHIHYTMNGGQDRLNSGDMLLIPPNIEHEFIYELPNISWVSVKFELDTDEEPWAGVIRQCPFTEKFMSALKTMVTGTILKPYEKMFIEGLIATLFTFIRSADFLEEEDPSSKFVRTIRDLVMDRNGKPVSINELANGMSYTRSHLSKQFKLHTGEGLKAYIDRVRVEKAKEMLRYEDLPISDISEELGYHDIFSFSRFFKRNTGMSPREFKERC